MKFCLSSRQPAFLLKSADEIRVDYKDKNNLSTLSQNFPTKRIILQIPKGVEVSWNICRGFAESHQGGFAVALEDLTHLDEVLYHNLDWFYAYPVDSCFFAQSLRQAGAKEMIPGMPLFFQMNNFKEVKFRLFPNVAYFPLVKRENGIHGQWIRPEDLDLYEDYASCVEFYPYGNLKKEAELFNIYAINKSWPGDLSLIIDYLNFNCDNRGILPDIAKTRISCGQSCEHNGNCHLCDRALSLNRVLVDKANG